jgi:hypothetical protein
MRRRMTRDPAFWLVAMGWVLGCQTSRFWADWGAPALMVLMAGDLQLFLQSRFAGFVQAPGAGVRTCAGDLCRHHQRRQQPLDI